MAAARVTSQRERTADSVDGHCANTRPRDGENDGGYAVADYGAADPRIGTMSDLQALAADLHDRGIALCIDLVLNHTAREHEWAGKAEAGDPAAWVTYLRCHDDIGWAVSDTDAAAAGLGGYAHRRFLNDFYAGRFPGSFARGVLFQDNPATGDARISGSGPRRPAVLRRTVNMLLARKGRLLHAREGDPCPDIAGRSAACPW